MARCNSSNSGRLKVFYPNTFSGLQPELTRKYPELTSSVKLYGFYDHRRAAAAVSPLSLTERAVGFILEAPCLGKFKTGHGSITCQWRNCSILPVKKQTEGFIIWLPVNLRNSLGRRPSRFVSGLGRLPSSSQTPQRGPKLYKLPHQKYRGSSFARAPSRSMFGDSFLRKLRLASVSRL